MKKRILLTLIMASLVVASFGGCGNLDSSESSSEKSGSSSAAETTAAEKDDAGDFTYFLFRDDTMETTYHTEFRYGSDL